MAKSKQVESVNHPEKGSRWNDGKQDHVVMTIAMDHNGQQVVVYTGDDGQTRTSPVPRFWNEVARAQGKAPPDASPQGKKSSSKPVTNR